MNRTYLILGLVTLIAVVSLIVGSDPETSARLSEARRNATLTGETRELALLGLLVVIGGFIAYLTLSRRS